VLLDIRHDSVELIAQNVGNSVVVAILPPAKRRDPLGDVVYGGARLQEVADALRGRLAFPGQTLKQTLQVFGRETGENVGEVGQRVCHADSVPRLNSRLDAVVANSGQARKFSRG